MADREYAREERASNPLHWIARAAFVLALLMFCAIAVAFLLGGALS